MLYEGFKYGFRIPFKGRVAGPYDCLPLEDLKVSPIGLVPKSSPGEFRLIFDFSYLRGFSMNTGIKKDN